MVQLNYVDPTGDGTEYPTPFPANLDKTIYNGSAGCKGCGTVMNPVQVLNSDICPSCSRERAARRVANRMA